MGRLTFFETQLFFEPPMKSLLFSSISVRFVLLLTCLMVLPWIAGCGKNVSLRGKVVFSDDGSPITSGTICFTDGKNLARGTIQPDGTFTMGSVGMSDGLLPGEYTVYFFDVAEAPADSSPNVMTSRRSLIDPKYNSQNTSDLRVTVDASTRTMEFKVDRNPQAAMQTR